MRPYILDFLWGRAVQKEQVVLCRIWSVKKTTPALEILFLKSP